MSDSTRTLNQSPTGEYWESSTATRGRVLTTDVIEEDGKMESIHFAITERSLGGVGIPLSIEEAKSINAWLTEKLKGL